MQGLTAVHEDPSSFGSGAAITVASLSKRFPNGTLALDDVSFTVPQGQVLTLLGLSGSGKSTLLRHINGLHAPTSGSVNVLGTDVRANDKRGLRQMRRDIGFVFQQFGLVGRVTCMENVLQGALGRLFGPRIGVRSYPVAMRREALEHLERVGLLAQAFQRADTLSGGQMQRVAIARSLMQQPKIMLADEPVASLDPESSVQVLELIVRIAREEGMTTILSLHQVELAMDWSDRIIGLRAGRMVLDSATADVNQSQVMRLYKSDMRETPAGAELTSRTA